MNVKESKSKWYSIRYKKDTALGNVIITHVSISLLDQRIL
jgi:hypothetical protein